MLHFAFQHKKLPGEGEGDIQGDDGQFFYPPSMFLSSLSVQCHRSDHSERLLCDEFASSDVKIQFLEVSKSGYFFRKSGYFKLQVLYTHDS